MGKRKTIKLNAYLLKASYVLGDPIITKGKMSEVEVDIPNASHGLLYVTQTMPHPPGWAWFIQPISEEVINNLKVASVGVVLIVPVDGRYFAACFGHGYAYLDKRYVEARFGLRTCLNILDPETIRFLDKRTFDSLGKLSHEQSTRPVNISEFGLEIDKDLLRSLVGRPEDDSFGNQIAGKDSICVRIPITMNQLPKFLRKCFRESKKNTYKKHFEFIDNIFEISDPEIIENLENQLVENINNGIYLKTWLAVPDIIKWEESAGFRYSKAKIEPIVDDVRLSRYLERWQLTGSLSNSDMKRHRIFQYGNDDRTVLNNWPVHHCLYAEIALHGETYILTEGAWYNINQNFVTSVQTEIDAIPRFRKQLPEWGDEHEQHYNERVCARSNGDMVLMDRKLILHGGGSSSIEFCDFLSTDNEIIHVKNYSGSSVLSHLFHQGMNAAYMTAGDVGFRKKVNKILPDTHKIPEDGAFRSSDYEVVFAIGTRDPIGFDLPFFSKVSLRNSSRNLRISGYRVSFSTIRRSKLTKIN